MKQQTFSQKDKQKIVPYNLEGGSSANLLANKEERASTDG
jgi:hypothetical protein